MYNVFVNRNHRQVATFSQPSAYDASALTHHFVDAGLHVFTDLWDAMVPDAMLSPAMAELAAVRYADRQPVTVSRNGGTFTGTVVAAHTDAEAVGVRSDRETWRITRFMYSEVSPV